MRKIAVFLCVVATLLSFLGCQEEHTYERQKNYTHGVYKLTITASEISNDSVGNDWRKSYSCDDRTIFSGEQWIVPLDATETVIIDAVITEVDKCSDVGYGSLCVVLTDGFKTSTTITVTENKGRYKGNKAQWKISCKVTLVEKLEQEQEYT
ncbi:MAG: hypothetical protein IJ298_08195 [Ruminococcus sp.]|nr:hypothetical protein [Ruminococcus sp.]